MRLFSLFAALVLALAAPQGAVGQQNLFAPRVIVNGDVVTNFEHQQRQLFFRLLNAPDFSDEAIERELIDDRLRRQAARREGIALTDAQLNAGLEEFAARGALTVEEFTAALQQAGVSPETFRDFVSIGLTWREVVRARFLRTAEDVSEGEIDRAASVAAQRDIVRVLLSEIVVPPDAADLARDLGETLRGEAAFAAAARQHSITDSAAQGGRLDWVPVANLPPQVVAQLAEMSDGGITQPVRVEQGFALYLLRSVDNLPGVTPRITAVDYMEYLIPAAGTPAALAEIERMRATILTCNDLYGHAKGQPAERLTRQTRTEPDLPADLAGIIARLDGNELALGPERGAAQSVIMLCSRRVASALPLSPAAFNERIALGRLEGQAALYLEQLRANATIRRP